MIEDAASVLKGWRSAKTDLEIWRGRFDANARYFAPQRDILSQNPQETPDNTGWAGLFSTVGHCGG